MIFNYDPILGLQYYSLNDIPIKIDLSVLKGQGIINFISEWRKYQQQLGISFYSSSEIEEVSLPIFDNLL